jgi:hypothetical protein
VALTASATDPSPADTAAGFTYAWSVTKAGANVTSGTGTAFGFTPVDDGAYVVQLNATDKDGATGQTTVDVTVTNVPPTPAIGDAPTTSVAEGSAVALTATATDASVADTAAGFTFEWSVTKDGAAFQTGTGASFSFTPDDNGAYDVTLTATDKDGATGQATANVTATNASPTPAIGDAPTASIGEGSAVALTATATDASADTAAGFTLEWSVTKDAAPFQTGTGASFSFTPDDNGSYVVTLSATDKDGATGQATANVTVTNVSPVLGNVTAPLDPVKTGDPVNSSVTFTDAGAADTHTALWTWGDGTTSAGTVTPGSGAVAGSHAYATPGVYTVQVDVTDDDAATASATYQYIVAYDPSSGFVTGAGWLNSPAGAYVADPGLAGRANFGFVSRYQNGATVPTGNTQFDFKVAGFGFRSTSYDWLVVAGARAQFKGEGAVNGAGEYGFMLTAVDGQLSGGGGTDKFRIKIWDKATGAVVYDNQAGAGDGTDPATVIGGGQIVIHR